MLNGLGSHITCAKLGPRKPLCPPCVFILCGESFNVRFKMFVLCVITVAGRSCGAELIKPACGGSSANETQCLEPFSRCSGGNASWKHPVKTARKKKPARGNEVEFEPNHDPGKTLLDCKCSVLWQENLLLPRRPTSHSAVHLE